MKLLRTIYGNGKIYTPFNIKILRLKCQIFGIFLLQGIIQVNCVKTEKNEGNVIVYVQGSRCTNHSSKFFTSVTCVDVLEQSDEFNHIKHLPARIFQQRHIWGILINDSDVSVDSNVLEGISNLRNFTVERSSIKNLPDFSFVKDSIREIKIESSLLTSLTESYLQNLTVVSKLSFSNNTIRSIRPNAFKDTVNIEILDLSRNLLEFIPETLLDPMKRLRTFKAQNNKLIHVNNMFTVTRPQEIILSNNNITDISSALIVNFKKTELLKRQRIYKCRKELNYRISFRSLFNISILDLRNNSIKETSQPIFPCLLRFPYDRSSVLEIGYFKLHENNLKNLNFLLRNLIIERLEVSKNQIEYLTEEDFKFTTGIAFLELQKNKIKRIDTETFRSLRTHLRYLDMSWNLITSLNRSLRYLVGVREVRLDRNSIKSFATDEFLGLHELIVFNLEHNQIKTIGLLQQLQHLQHLVINDNDIESVRPDQFTENLQRMNLADNPIKCNCLFHLFIRRLNASSVRTDIHNICSKPVSAVSVQEKFSSQDLCTYRCTQYKNDSYIFADCSSKNLADVPRFFENNLADIEILAILSTDYIIGKNDEDFIANITYYTFHIEDQILGVSLENNSLESLDAVQLPPNLIELYLSENKLRKLPESMLENQRNLKQVTLSGNPWKCDCDTIQFKKWLTTEKEKIKDIENVCCGVYGKEVSHLNGRVIWNLADLDLCPTQNDQTFSTSMSTGVLTFVIFCLAAKVLYTKYRLNIKVFLYTHGFTFVREEDLNYDKVFDAFISFSHDDDEFVINEIISEIEKRNPNIHLCLHYRHFTAGELIITNITRAVRNSKRTVLILSRNFLESEWCLLEARTAHSQAMEDKVHRIIMIKVGDLPEEMDPLIKAYLVSTTYITWGENNFWNKLLYVLPSQVRCEESVSDNMKKNETVHRCSFFDS